MKNTNRSIGAIVNCVTLFSAGCVFAQDWPQWRGPHRDGKVNRVFVKDKDTVAMLTIE